MIGRAEEKKTIQYLMESKEAEFLAVTGRRRVGKTFLIDTVFADHICFKMVGIQNQGPEAQLLNFAVKLSEFDEDADVVVPKNWQWAFIKLKSYLKKLPKDKKQVIFIDELPWVAASDKSFVQMLAHLWNDYISTQPHFILVICGSATSWIIQKIIGDPGGMHNRVTMRIHMEPFSLSETKQFLDENGIGFNDQQIAKAYMAFGGIPYYLKYFKRGDTLVTGVNRICFKPSGGLRLEYQSLYSALFQNSDIHESIIKALAAKSSGLNRAELKRAIEIKSNSSFDRAIDELVLSDFIVRDYPFGRKKRGVVYRLVDEFSIFYHRFMQQQNDYEPDYWSRTVESQTYKIWLGHAFERLCRKHVGKIKDALRISGMYAPASTLSIPPVDGKDGAQIDLLLDRADEAINLCEMKFYADEFTISKNYSQKLLRKKWRFQEYTKTKKQVFITMVTNHPVKRNEWFLGTVDAVVTLDDIIR